MSEFRKSSSSGNSGCVGVDIGPFHVTVVDLKDPTGPFLTFNHREWAAFLAGVARGEFELPKPARYAVQNRGAVWAIHDNEQHADVSVQVVEQTAEAMCHLLNESLREEAS